MKKGKLYSILYLKCPRCNSGNLFSNEKLYRRKGFFDMPERCSHCGLKYQPEPGFFYGAMFVSYGLSILITGLVWFILTLFGFDFMAVIWASVITLLISMPLVFRLSRAIWINLFIHFEESGWEGDNKKAP